jgi:Domain of unknown function (DUF1840)
MLYKFKSKAAGDVIMTQPVGDRVLQALGREHAPQGIFQADHLPSLMAALEQAIETEERLRERLEAEAQARGETPPPREAVSLRQRAWPLIEMMKRARQEDQDIVWGV